MKSILRSSLSIAVLAAGVASVGGVAKADPNNPSDNDKAAARPFAIEGLRLAQAGNCRDAVDKLERGEALVHAPTTAVPLAQCDIQLGKIIAGTEILNRVINESIPQTAPPSWADAQKQAHTILEAAQPRIAKLRIHVDVPPGVTPNPEVTVDGQPVASVLLDNDRPTDPGTHHVTAKQAGAGIAEADVTVTDGQVRAVALRLGGAGPTAGAAPVAAPAAAVTDSGPNGAAVSSAASTDSGDKLAVSLEFGVHLSFASPFGADIAGNQNDLDRAVTNVISPLGLDFGVRLASHWYVGGYFSYGFATVSNDGSPECARAGFGCSGTDVRFGVNAQYHVLPDGRFDPWFGIGSGYEWLTLSETEDATVSGTGLPFSGSLTQSGFEFANFQGGLDFRLLDGALGIGPFVSLAIAQYSNVSTSTSTGASTSSSIMNQAIHEWFFIGARGDYDLKLR